MNYKKLKYDFFEEVGKIDVSKLGFGLFGGLKDYAELLIVMAEIPEESKDERNKIYGFANTNATNISEVPKIEKGGK